MKFPRDVACGARDALSSISLDSMLPEPFQSSVLDIDAPIIAPKGSMASRVEAQTYESEYKYPKDITDSTSGLDDSVRLYNTAEGAYTIVWDGTMNDASVLSSDSTLDIAEVRIEFQPLGYPENNTDCVDPVNPDTGESTGPHEHGNDYGWTR